MSNYNDNKKYKYNNASYSYYKSNKPGKKSPVEDDEIEIVGTRPAFNGNFSPIGRDIIFPQGGQ